MGWTPSRTLTAETMWLEGKSASEIAKELGGITRNAVIGKMHRMGHTTRGAPSDPQAIRRENYEAKGGRKPPKPSTRAPKVAKPKAPRIGRTYAEVIYSAEPVTSPLVRPWIERTARQCAFPIDGDGGEVNSCCNPTDGRSYCAGHYRMMYRTDREGGAAKALKRSVYDARYIEKKTSCFDARNPDFGVAA